MLEHATRHKSRAVRRFLTHHAGVGREHWAPESHPLERFWQWLTAKGDGATAVDTLDDGIHKGRQLLWHYHEGWLTSTSHVDCKDYQNIVSGFLMSHLDAESSTEMMRES